MKEKTALVTGSSRGIGRSIALNLAQRGFKVAINYYNGGNDAGEHLEQAQEVLQEVQTMGAEGIIIGADVSVAESATALVDQTIEKWGRLDVLVNNAAINQDQLLLRVSDDLWDLILKTNLYSAFYCSRTAVRYMIKKRYGRIINISSVVGLAGNIGQTCYAASKSGLLGLTCSIAKEYGARGVTANIIAPGFIESDMTRQLPAEVSARMIAQIPAGRLGKADDVANLVCFLATPEASYINGQTIRIDGGMSI